MWGENMIVKAKTGDIHCDVFRDKEGISENIKFFRAIATDDNFNEMGYANFTIKDDGSIWLYHIKTDEKYSHQGIATILINAMEYFAVLNYYVKHVEGKYYPENEFAESFYKKNGYDILEDSYSYFIVKSLYRKDVLDKAQTLFQESFEEKDYQEYLKDQKERDQIVETVLTRKETKKHKVEKIVINARNEDTFSTQSM